MIPKRQNQIQEAGLSGAASRISFCLVPLTLVLVGWVHLATPLLAVLFSLFVLHKLHFASRKWLAAVFFVVVVLATAYGTGQFFRSAVIALPKIAETSIPSVIAWAEARNMQLPFTDYQSLKTLALNTATEQARYLGNFANFAKGATTQLAFLLIGAVVAVSLFFNSQLDLDRGRHAVPNNLYSLWCDEITARFRTFYHSFTTVMGAQIIISGVNTALTSAFLFAFKLPFAAELVGVTFLCGLLPVVGNLISNTIIVCVAFTVSPKMALIALSFLVVIHKFEYFLNGKIIGNRIRNPVWLTLLGLIIGERLLGVPGMILAPVVLHYLKVEASRIEVKGAPPTTGLAPDRLDERKPIPLATEPEPEEPEPARRGEG